MILRNVCIVALAGALGLWAAPAIAQGRGPGPGCGPGGWGREGAYWRLFDPNTVETVSGEIVSVQRIRPVKGVSGGIHIDLKTERDTIPVHLGPAWYIDNQEPQIAAKDKVEIVGSRIQINGKTAIIASELRKGSESLRLRDTEGNPLWCGWRRR